MIIKSNQSHALKCIQRFFIHIFPTQNKIIPSFIISYFDKKFHAENLYF